MSSAAPAPSLLVGAVLAAGGILGGAARPVGGESPVGRSVAREERVER
jgi:hypothetical protein